ncbi:hypothetical protein FRC06_004022 [Ceratobasidium sp. 370]|nr:hypothetical protein FRC06_004022 [Ceratobasidium sp. 370]
MFWLSLSRATGLKEEIQFNPVKYYHDWGSSEPPLHRRQVPVVVAPPTVPRPITNTPLVPQPTSSLNYWWPYGSNGVDPTVTPTQTLGLSSASGTSTVDDPTSTATTDETASATSSSASNVGTSATTTTTAMETPSETLESIPKSNVPGFKVISLLPLFIILGVLLLATFMGWTYGRCIRWCQRRKEPVPGGSDIGGRPYEFGGYDSDTIGPMRSAGIGWVDASRIYDRHDSSGVAYHATRSGQASEPGTPSKSKDRAPGPGGWFRHTFSRRKGPNEISPSGEKGLNHSVDKIRPRRTLPPSAYRQLTSQRISSSPSDLESPRLLRVVNGSPSTLGNGFQSPTSTQPTPYISASRHGSIRRKLVERVQAGNEQVQLAASGTPGAFRNFEDEDRRADNWVNFKADPLKRSPARRFASRANTPGSPQSLTRSLDPQEHRARMRRLRAAAQASATVSNVTSPSETLEACHPLPPAPNVLLSPPLQPHLFFIGSDQDDVYPKGDDSLAQGNRSRNLNGRTTRLAVDDPFGSLITPSAQPMQRTRAKRKSLKYRTESTETAPLSPELRDAAMTRFEEIVRSNWSTRNLAGVPQSPTLFGAFSPPSSHGFYADDENHRAECEDTLLGQPGGQVPT